MEYLNIGLLILILWKVWPSFVKIAGNIIVFAFLAYLTFWTPYDWCLWFLILDLYFIWRQGIQWYKSETGIDIEIDKK